jgi:FkbM family methyltransferase
MLDNLRKAVRKPGKAMRYIRFFTQHLFRKRKGTLVFIGAESGGMFSLMHRGFEKSFVFEANPHRYRGLQQKFGNDPHIELHHVAVADHDGEIQFHISNNNNGASSSIGTFKEEWNHKYNNQKIEMVETVTVRCINLAHFLEKKGVNFVDEYVSDIQGMDLTVLKTMATWINQKRIGAITCEVAKDGHENIYRDLPPNNQSGFEQLLRNNYQLVATGWGVIPDGTFERIPPTAWEMDCRWKAIN